MDPHGKGGFPRLISVPISRTAYRVGDDDEEGKENEEKDVDELFIESLVNGRETVSTLRSPTSLRGGELSTSYRLSCPPSA